MCSLRPTSFGVCTNTLNYQPSSLPWSSSPMCLCSCRWEPLQPWVYQPGQSSILSSQGPESPRGGAGWLSFSFLQTLLRTLPPPPAGVTAATRTCRCMAWRSTGRNSHLTVNPAPQHPRRRGPGAGSSAVQRWLSPVSHQGLGGCPWSRGATGNFGANFANFFLGVESRRSERLRQQQRGPQTGFVHLETGPPAPEGARDSPACPPRAPAPPGPGPPATGLQVTSSTRLQESQRGRKTVALSTSGFISLVLFLFLCKIIRFPPAPSLFPLISPPLPVLFIPHTFCMFGFPGIYFSLSLVASVMFDPFLFFWAAFFLKFILFCRSPSVSLPPSSSVSSFSFSPSLSFTRSALFQF
ncbi:rCG44289 [Rattus norvegicus]|uniref:RCG44289 n=1 Tax=Rattus norvegicus TaxID=10116 RepID=A6KD67_RAT|nr:rCG44289 [Rattus norvegicus]|eukprot:XP_017456909.1 PREDICTED: uncharacterized protein LOC102554898 [Rattus norvegicus]